MRVAFLHTLREAFQRRMSLVLLAVCLISAIFYVIQFRFETGPDGQVTVPAVMEQREVLPDGQVVSRTVVIQRPLHLFMNENMPGQLNFTGFFWLILGALAAVPLITSFHETGWVELLVSKNISRWELLLGRYLAAFAQFAAALLLVCGVPALHVWMGTGISTLPFLKGVVLILFGYACTLAFSTLLAVLQPSVGLVAVVTFAQLGLSPVLAQRQDQFKELPSVRVIADFLYHVLPKNDELRRMSIDVFYSNPVESWAPLWSSAIFLVVTLAAACLIFQRKSL